MAKIIKLNQPLNCANDYQKEISFFKANVIYSNSKKNIKY